MKRIYARITMALDVTDEEYEKVYKEYEENFDVEVVDDLLKTFKEKGVVDENWGDSYIPGHWFEFL